ncbi:hypothetical protein U1Q18_025810, partial [Sarracenia purpurea var. burkii]
SEWLELPNEWTEKEVGASAESISNGFRMDGSADPTKTQDGASAPRKIYWPQN